MERTATMRHDGETLARGLGWFSLALGSAELLAPGTMARLAGADESDSTTRTVRAFGAREIASGIFALSQPDRARWMWTRVAGDGLDLTWLSTTIAGSRNRGRAIAATAAVAGVAALDVVAAARLGRDESTSDGARRESVRVEEAVTINRPIEDVYRFWRDFSNLPRFMRHLEAVDVQNDRRSRWRAKAPAGMTVQWEAEIVTDREYEWIAWRSLPGADVENHGSVRFSPAPGARGTEVRVELEYHPPAGAVGRAIAWLFGREPSQEVREDLRRFKQIMETGQIPMSDAPGLWRAARPPKKASALRKKMGVHA